MTSAAVSAADTASRRSNLLNSRRLSPWLHGAHACPHCDVAVRCGTACAACDALSKFDVWPTNVVGAATNPQTPCEFRDRTRATHGIHNMTEHEPCSPPGTEAERRH